jgi:hypothetical protein
LCQGWIPSWIRQVSVEKEEESIPGMTKKNEVSVEKEEESIPGMAKKNEVSVEKEEESIPGMAKKNEVSVAQVLGIYSDPASL